MIENKYLYFKTYQDFRDKLDRNLISDTSIVFIEDRSIIWTHGKEFTKSDAVYPGTGNNALLLNTTDNVASGNNSVAEGYQSQAIGFASHAEGHGSKASDRSHAEGDNTTASANGAHSEGNRTTASGVYSHAEGEKGMAMGGASHVEGRGSNQPNTITSESTNEEIQSAWSSAQFSLAKGWSSHVEGDNGLALADGAHAEGYCCRAIGSQAHAEGNHSKALGDKSHSEGDQTQANNSAAHSEGTHTIAGGNSSHAEGIQSTASSTASHAEGNGTTASGFAAHAEGHGTQATIDRSHAEGNFTIASGDAAHAEGQRTVAAGQDSHAGGSHSTASTSRSFVHGDNLVASYNDNEVAFGKFNRSSSTTLFSIGGGSDADNRKNLFEISPSGEIFADGIGGFNGIRKAGDTSLQTAISQIDSLEENIRELDGKCDSIESNVYVINDKIPSEATVSNQLADKAYVDSQTKRIILNNDATSISQDDYDTLLNSEYPVSIFVLWGGNLYPVAKFYRNTNTGNLELYYFNTGGQAQTLVQWKIKRDLSITKTNIQIATISDIPNVDDLRSCVITINNSDEVADILYETFSQDNEASVLHEFIVDILNGSHKRVVFEITDGVEVFSIEPIYSARYNNEVLGIPSVEFEFHFLKSFTTTTDHNTTTFSNVQCTLEADPSDPDKYVHVGSYTFS